MTRRALLTWSLAVTLGACARPAPVAPDAGCRPGGGAPPEQVVFGGSRPVKLSVPRTYDGACPAPLLLVLHGYGASGPLQTAYLGLTALVDGRGVLLAAPDGTVDSTGRAFWDVGIDACCNFGGSPVDDVGYLRGLIEEIRGVYNVDPKRIFVVGHSNGGFMAHRLGCELSSTVSAVVSLAGTVSEEPIACRPAVPVSVLQIHGDLDDVVFYDGGTNVVGRGGGPYASAPATVARWAAQNGCGASQTAGAPVDLETTLPGAETTVSSFDGCPADTDVALWTIEGGSHLPTVGGKFPGVVWRWLDAHARP